MYKTNTKGVFNRIHAIVSNVDALYFSGFLGQIPTDIWSKIYTSWLRLAGAHIGKHSIVHYRVKVWHPENLFLGRGVRVPASTDMACMGRITVGDYTLLGANISFITNNHPLEDNNLSWQEVLAGTQEDITIGKFCWIMNNSTLIAGRDGLKVGNNSWVAAGSIVTRNINQSELWGGMRASFIRKVLVNRK